MANNQEFVVVGIDGSAESRSALRWALKEATILSARVEVVHCYLPQTLTDLGFSTPHELHTASSIMLQSEVSAAVREMPEPPQVVQISSLGNPGSVLVEKANDAAILVLGAHGRTALRDVILGRVADAVLRHAHCPVVIVGLDQTAVRHNTREKLKSRAPEAVRP